MTTTPIPAAAAAPPMAHTPDTQPDQNPLPAAQAVALDGAIAESRIRLRDQIAVNPLLSLFGAVLTAILGAMGAVIIALLAHSLATTNDRFAGIEERFTAIEERFTRLEAKVDAQDVKLDEINLKLTALIAALNMAKEVDAALQGTLLNPTTTSGADTAPPP